MLLIALSAAPVRAADVTGTWRVTISTPEGVITGKASFRQTGQAVSGWVGPSEDDPIPIAGILKGNKLTIKTSPQSGRTVAFDKCDVTVNGEKMAGTIDNDKGTIEFVKSALRLAGHESRPGNGRRMRFGYFFSIQLIQYSFHSTLSPAGSTSMGLRPSSMTALSSVNAFFP